MLRRCQEPVELGPRQLPLDVGEGHMFTPEGNWHLNEPRR